MLYNHIPLLSLTPTAGVLLRGTFSSSTRCACRLALMTNMYSDGGTLLCIASWRRCSRRRNKRISLATSDTHTSHSNTASKEKHIPCWCDQKQNLGAHFSIPIFVS